MTLSTLRRAALPLLALLVLAGSASAQSYRATLSGANERPTPNASPATGTIGATLTGSTLVLTGAFSGFTGNYAASHIHTGTASASGPVIISLTPTIGTDQRSGTFAAAANTFTLTPAQVTALQSDGLYVNVHSQTFTGGEIRGQLVVGAPISSVRTAALNSTVTAEGVVTRALGRNVWIQDDTAGLVLFGPAGSPLATAIASGAIAAGDRITATGRLVEFQATVGAPGTGLLEIDTILEGGFTVLARAQAAPAVQTLTLAQLGEGDPDTEVYESEIVRITNLTIDAAGDVSFVAAKNYTVSQTVGGVTTTAILRTGSATDSEVVGTAIPTGLFTYQGPANQFRSANQLLPVRTTDIVPGGTATAETPAGRLSLDVANPLRGAARVRFSTETAQAVRLALYDALGREVAVVAEGVSAGAQSAVLDTAALAPGVYVLRLTAGAGALTQTVTVVR